MEVASIICDMCNAGYGDKPGKIQETTMRCVECQNNYCDKCVEVHKSQKLSRNHKVIKIGSDAKSEINQITEYCRKHTKKALDYYCFDCKKIVCVSCFVESHASHTVKDVTILDEEFRQTIQAKAPKVIEKTRVVEGKAEKQLREITECPICMSSFTDPRILPCIHTFCFECLNRTAEAAKKKPGDRMPCPVCSKDFFIPADGVNGLHKNYFMENLLEFKISLQIGGAIVICDMCNVRNEGKIGDISKATMRCLECQDYYCNSCVKIHQFQKLTRNHQLVKIGREIAPEMKRQFGTLHCSKHTQRTLDYYCADCKKIVCVSCFVESHASHKCKDVTTVGEEFRQTIEKKAEKISTYAKETLLLRNNNEKRKADFWKEIAEQEQKIHERSQELKDTIDRHVLDRHTNSLLDELSVIKSKHLKEMETEMEKIDRYITTLKDFESYCTELALEGSARDICSSFDELVLRANELGKKHEALNDQPHHSVGFYFQATDLADVFQNADSNCVGKIKEKTSRFEDSAAVVGLDELRDSNKERRKNKSTPANSTGINRCRVQ